MYSKLVDHVRLSPNCTKPRNKKIDAIVIHHVAGNATVEAVGAHFANPKAGASSNYGVGTDGRVACYVEEENRSWATSSPEIDHRAITIEVANCSGDPDWRVSDQALEATIALCVDVCNRHGFKLNYTGNKTGNLHMHKWYAATGCPGPYLGSKFGYIAEEVNRRLGGEPPAEKPQKNPETNQSKPKEGYTMNMRIMKQGDSGEDVRALQILLKGNGYDLGEYGPKKDGVDGQYGAATAKAVRELEKDRGLDQDEGTAGPQVMGSLLGTE